MDEVRSRPPSFSERLRPAPLICASVDYYEPESPVERSIIQEKEEIEYHTNALLSSSLPLSEIQELLRLINKIAFNNSFYHTSPTPISSLHSPKASLNNPPNPLHLILPLIEPNAGGETISTTSRVVIDLFAAEHVAGLSAVVVQDTEFVILLFDLANRESFVQLDELFQRFTSQLSSSVRRQAKLILVGKTHSNDAIPSEYVDRHEIDHWCKLQCNVMASVVFLEYSSLYAQGVRDLLSIIVEPFQAQLNAHHTKLEQINKKKKESPIQTNSLQFFNQPASQQEETAEAEAKRLKEEKLRDLRAKKVYDIEQAMHETLLADWQESETLAAQYELQLLQSRSEDTPPQPQRPSSSIYRLASSNLSILIDNNSVNDNNNNNNNNSHVSLSFPTKKDLASMVEAMHAPRDVHALYLAGMHTSTTQLDFKDDEDDLFALDDDDDDDLMIMESEHVHWKKKLSTTHTGGSSAVDYNKNAAAAAAAASMDHNHHQALEHQSSSDSAIYDSQHDNSNSNSHHDRKNQLLLAAASTSFKDINCGHGNTTTELDDLHVNNTDTAPIVGGERHAAADGPRRRWYHFFFFSCCSSY